MAKREKTKHKGIYKVGNTYYITYYVGSKKYEKAVGYKLSMALKEKVERERKGKRGVYEVLERQEKTSFKELFALYEKRGMGKDISSSLRKLMRNILESGSYLRSPETTFLSLGTC